MALVKLIQGKQVNVNLTGSFTGSFTGNGSGLTNLPVQSINTGSFVLTSSFNSFTGSYSTGSFTGSFTGPLRGTSSWAVSSSFAVSSSHALQADNATNSVTSQVSDSLVGFQTATVEQINVGETGNTAYTYMLKTQELEQSKHTTNNIYNNLNFI